MSFYEDLLGDQTPVSRGPGRPPGIVSKPRDAAQKSASLKTSDVHLVVGGVTIVWLMKAFRMGRGAVERALALGNCNPTGTSKNGGAYYDLPEAAACLVAPKTDLKAFLKTIKPADLPQHMQDGYWAAKLKEQKYRLDAGELWPTSSVIDVLADTFKAIKEQTMLWADTLEERVNLLPDQHNALTHLVDQLLDDLRKNMIAREQKSSTRSQLAELDDDI